MFYVIIHSNVRLIKFFLHRLKEERFSLPTVCFFVLNSNQKCLFGIRENGRFSSPVFVKPILIPTRFRELLCKTGWRKTIDLRIEPGELSSVSCVWKLLRLLGDWWSYQSLKCRCKDFWSVVYSSENDLSKPQKMGLDLSRFFSLLRVSLSSIPTPHPWKIV